MRGCRFSTPLRSKAREKQIPHRAFGPVRNDNGLRFRNHDFETTSLLSTLKAPGNWLARIPAMFLSIVLLTVP